MILEKEDLLNLVKGTCPNFDVMSNPLIADSGEYCGGMVDEWQWTNLKDKTEEQLEEIYKICKASWVK